MLPGQGDPDSIKKKLQKFFLSAEITKGEKKLLHIAF